jgi:hypothetical protein
MNQTKPKKWILLAVSILVILSAALGLFAPDFYAARDNAMTTFEIAGQDVISLACGLLLLTLAVLPKKSPLTSVVTAGLLVYTAYIYAYFLFGLLVTPLFVVYLVITSMSFYALIGMVTELAGNPDLPVTTAQKWVSGYLIFIVVVVGIIDGSGIVGKTILSKGAMTTQGAFYYLDLAFLFPGMVIAAVLNWRGKSIGRFFSGAFLIKTTALMPALILSDALHYVNTGTFVDLSFDIIAAVVMCSAIFFFRLYSIDVQAG